MDVSDVRDVRRSARHDKEEIVVRNLSSPRNIRAFRGSLLRWYRRHGRDLPWRKTRDPYAILVSEFMLQQTQVATVIPYYNGWLRRFPDFASLAARFGKRCPPRLAGLGYYDRARNLHAAAKIVAGSTSGDFPRDRRSNSRNSRVSADTRPTPSPALLSINQSQSSKRTPPVCLARLFELRESNRFCARPRKDFGNTPRACSQTQCSAISIPRLSILARSFVFPRQPKCGICPVKRFCRAKNPEALPIKKSKPRTKRLIEKHALVVRQRQDLAGTIVRTLAWHVDSAALETDCLKQSSPQGCSSRVGVSVHESSGHACRASSHTAPKTKSRSTARGSRSMRRSSQSPSPHRRERSTLLLSVKQVAAEHAGRSRENRDRDAKPSVIPETDLDMVAHGFHDNHVRDRADNG